MRLSAEQFELIMGSLRSFQHGGRTVEKRRQPRVGLRVTATLLRCDSCPSKPTAHTVKVRDLSAEGIGLVHATPVPAGAQVIVSFLRATGELLPILYKVVHCHRLSDQSYALGARLLRVVDTGTHDLAARKPAKQQL